MCEAALSRKECDGAASFDTKRMWLGKYPCGLLHEYFARCAVGIAHDVHAMMRSG